MRVHSPYVFDGRKSKVLPRLSRRLAQCSLGNAVMRALHSFLGIPKLKRNRCIRVSNCIFVIISYQHVAMRKISPWFYCSKFVKGFLKSTLRICSLRLNAEDVQAVLFRITLLRQRNTIGQFIKVEKEYSKNKSVKHER